MYILPPLSLTIFTKICYNRFHSKDAENLCLQEFQRHFHETEELHKPWFSFWVRHRIQDLEDHLNVSL
ncbi:hypothetical protein Hanom_Chr06g00550921 [Helianthus anomalus]